MGTGDLNTGLASPNALIEQKLRAEQVVKNGAGWFLAIAGLSIVNSVMTISGGNFHFIFGLGVTEIVDAIGKRSGMVGSALGLIVNAFVAAVFVLFWHFGRTGRKWAFLAGMVLYAIDGLILVPFADWLGVAFHAYALFRIYNGMLGIPILEKVQRAMTGLPPAIEPA